MSLARDAFHPLFYFVNAYEDEPLSILTAARYIK